LTARTAKSTIAMIDPRSNAPLIAPSRSSRKSAVLGLFLYGSRLMCAGEAV
jgi:hypothetical protein